MRIVATCAAVGLAAAVLPWPYAYYQALRLGVFAAGVYCGVQSKARCDEKLTYGLFFIALVFNPFLPVYLSREIWFPLDLVASALFAYRAYARTSISTH